MKIIHDLEKFSSTKPIVLTIGNFDGVHKGHSHLLNTIKQIAGTTHETCAITFDSHPSTTLRPHQPTPLLCTFLHRLQLLKQSKLDHLIVLNFNAALAELTAESFTQKLRLSIPFTHMILGHDATIGKGRHGNRETMQHIAKEMGFEIHYIDEYKHPELLISSTHIRHQLQKGHLENVSELLGRPYSVYSTVIHGAGKGKQLGFPTANIDVTNLCIPPLGVYAVHMKKIDGLIYKGIANLGVAPTMKDTPSPCLEVYLFNEVLDLYNENVEVFFDRFIRPEKKFASIDELKQQIQADVVTAMN